MSNVIFYLRSLFFCPQMRQKHSIALHSTTFLAVLQWADFQNRVLKTRTWTRSQLSVTQLSRTVMTSMNLQKNLHRPELKGAVGQNPTQSHFVSNIWRAFLFRSS